MLSQLPFGLIAKCDGPLAPEEALAVALQSQLPFGLIAKCDKAWVKMIESLGYNGLNCLSA